MADQPLVTYLRTYRRRTGLSQTEVAFLIGSIDGKLVSRHECGERLPTLHTVLKYSFILGVPVHDIYEGLSTGVRRDICTRAGGLIRQLQRTERTWRRDRKLRLLEGMIQLGVDERAG